MSSRFVLHHYALSSSSWRVRWALAVKGIEYESVHVDLRGGEQHREAHREKNPIGHVPALVVDGRALAESVAIIEWLEDFRPEPALYPKDPWERARVRQIVETVNAGIQPLQNTSVQERHSSDPAERRAFAAHFNARGLAAMEKLLVAIDQERGATGTFAYGDSLTAADLYLVPQVFYARRFDVDLSGLPRVLAAETAANATPHAAAARPAS
jgi:maleylacetoacetate isomerase